MKISPRAVSGLIDSRQQRLTELKHEARAARINPEAETYLGLTPKSLAFATLRPGRATAAVNLVLPAYSPGATFAGMKTALETGALVAKALGLPLRVVVLRGKVNESTARSMRQFVQQEFSFDAESIEVDHVQTFVTRTTSDQDYWIATYWTTAHALDVAARLGIVDRGRVLYLIQDYEPGFAPWSTNFAIAQTTYHAGFVPLINSSPLHDYLVEREGLTSSKRTTFAPSLDLDRLELASRHRSTPSIPKILFYGRSSKPRNMFALGVSSLRAAARQLDSVGLPAEFASVGETHRRIDLSPLRQMSSMGKLSWQDYFKVLGNADIVVSLQASPHPSHPPLDAVVSGGISVTNELQGTRGGLHPRLRAASADPDAIATEIVAAVDASLTKPPGGYSPDFLGRLGLPLESAVHSAISNLA